MYFDNRVAINLTGDFDPITDVTMFCRECNTKMFYNMFLKRYCCNICLAQYSYDSKGRIRQINNSGDNDISSSINSSSGFDTGGNSFIDSGIGVKAASEVSAAASGGLNDEQAAADYSFPVTSIDEIRHKRTAGPTDEELRLESLGITHYKEHEWSQQEGTFNAIDGQKEQQKNWEQRRLMR